jgi:hypothetical protein
MINGFFYKNNIPKIDTIVIGKVLKSIEEIIINIFLLEYNVLAFIEKKKSNNILDSLKDGEVLSFLVISNSNNKIRLSNKYIVNNNNKYLLFNKYKRVISCLLKVSKKLNISYHKLACKTIWRNCLKRNLFYFYLIKKDKSNIIDINYKCNNKILELIKDNYYPINNFKKIKLKLIVKNIYNYVDVIKLLKENIDKLDFIKFNIDNIPMYNIIYDENFWYNKNLLLRLINYILDIYQVFFIKKEII